MHWYPGSLGAGELNAGGHFAQWPPNVENSTLLGDNRLSLATAFTDSRLHVLVIRHKAARIQQIFQSRRSMYAEQPRADFYCSLTTYHLGINDVGDLFLDSIEHYSYLFLSLNRKSEVKQFCDSLFTHPRFPGIPRFNLEFFFMQSDTGLCLLSTA